MLFVKRLVLIDLPEETGKFAGRAEGQWGAGDLVAVRVKSRNAGVMGSTIPKTLAYDAVDGAWSAAWLEEDKLPPASITASDVVATPAVPQQEHEEEAAEPPAPAAPAPEEEQEEPEEMEELTANTDASSHAGGEAGVEGDAAPVAEELTTADADADADAKGIAAVSTDAAPEDVTAIEASANTSGSQAAEAPAAHTAATTTHAASAPPQQPASPMTVDQLVGIELLCSPDNCLIELEVITIFGVVKCTAVANISSVFAEAPLQHFAAVLWPNGAAKSDPRTVFGVLEFTVALPEWLRAQSAPVAELVRFSPAARVPTPIATPVAAVSTVDLYFPACFLTSTGAYIVSNVVCFESASDREVAVRFATTGESHIVKVTPSKFTLRAKGERVFVCCTLDLFPRAKPSAAAAARGPLELTTLYALLREDGVNVAPIDFTIHSEPPEPSETNPSFLFWANTTKVSNMPCMAHETAEMQAVLPVYAMLKRLSAAADEAAAATTGSPAHSDSTSPHHP